MDNNITAEEFIERINNGERCFSGYCFKDVTIVGGATILDKDYKDNLTFDNCAFERLELLYIGLNRITICNCDIHDLIIKNTEIFESNIFSNRITNLEVKDSHIDKCYICNIRGIKKSTIHNSSIYDSLLDHIVIEDMIFSSNVISCTSMTRIMILLCGMNVVFMGSKFNRIKIFQSFIRGRSYFYKCKFMDVVISESLLRGMVTYESNITDTIQSACPTTGSFIGYKVVKTIPEVSPGDDIVEIILSKSISTFLIAVLEIPEDAKRSSAYTNKCRADKAKVLRFENLDGTEYTDATEAMSASYKFSNTIYKVGEMVYADEFDEKPYNECSNGIHFFVDRKSAVEYLGLI